MDVHAAPPHSGRQQASDAMRVKLLETATTILAREGIAGLTARRLSAAAGASTKVVYSHFGGMPGIIRALYDRGFETLAQSLSKALASAPKGQGIAAVVDAYRGFAADHPDTFDQMYGQSIATLLPTPETRTPARAALEVLVREFARIGHSTPDDQARGLWAAMHGIVALEHAGWFSTDEAERRLAETVARFATEGQ